MTATDTLTPVESWTGAKVHATTAGSSCGRRVPTLCGRSVLAAATYAPGTFDVHVRNVPRGYGSGACEGCARAMGLLHLYPRPHYVGEGAS